MEVHVLIKSEVMRGLIRTRMMLLGRGLAGWGIPEVHGLGQAWHWVLRWLKVFNLILPIVTVQHVLDYLPSIVQSLNLLTYLLYPLLGLLDHLLICGLLKVQECDKWVPYLTVFLILNLYMIRPLVHRGLILVAL